MLKYVLTSPWASDPLDTAGKWQITFTLARVQSSLVLIGALIRGYAHNCVRNVVFAHSPKRWNPNDCNYAHMSMQTYNTHNEM